MTKQHKQPEVVNDLTGDSIKAFRLPDGRYVTEKLAKEIEEPVKDFPTTDKEMSDFLATHKPIQVPDKYKTADWLFKEQPVCEELEEEINRYYSDNFYELPPFSIIDEVARHFAQWQKEHDDKETAELLTIAHLQGSDQMREQMMKGAVEGEVENGIYLSGMECSRMGLKLGDKVRIIIVKED